MAWHRHPRSSSPSRMRMEPRAKETDWKTAGPPPRPFPTNAPASFLTMIWRDDQPIAAITDQVDITQPIRDKAAIYRVEIITSRERGSVPWIISNPIYVGMT